MVVDALKAYESGVVFYGGNDSVWLADFVPPVFVK
jgi:RNA:NAD 2'-phosphotransferase (TPT1/KptA family)